MVEKFEGRGSGKTNLYSWKQGKRGKRDSKQTSPPQDIYLQPCWEECRHIEGDIRSEKGCRVLIRIRRESEGSNYQFILLGDYLGTY